MVGIPLDFVDGCHGNLFVGLGVLGLHIVIGYVLHLGDILHAYWLDWLHVWTCLLDGDILLTFLMYSVVQGQCLVKSF